MKVVYPIYLKYSNNKSFFKITAADAFEELQVMPSAYSIHRIKATTLPDRNYIHDMVQNEGERWEAITQEEYQSQLEYCQSHLKLL